MLLVSQLFTSTTIDGTWRTKDEEPTKGTYGVSAKDASKVKLVTEGFPITLKIWELEESA